MVEIISRVSRGTVMDQIYIPKNRSGIAVGTYVVIKPLETEKQDINPVYYHLKNLEPIKVGIIKVIFNTIDSFIDSENAIITGSFLDEGFRFNDLDIIIVTDEKINQQYISEALMDKTGIKMHLIVIDSKALSEGLSTDPLFRIMLCRCVSKKRMIYIEDARINYKILDLHILKSKLLAKNFDFLTGAEKYEMVRNLVAIHQFIDKKQVTRSSVDESINKLFGSGTVQKLKDNILPKKQFSDKYNKIYNETQKRILRGIENGSKQK